MTDQEKISAILSAVNSDPAKLLIVLKGAVNKNLPNVSSEQLNMIMAALGIPNAVP